MIGVAFDALITFTESSGRLKGVLDPHISTTWDTFKPPRFIPLTAPQTNEFTPKRKRKYCIDS
jgi:hypothetical protein